MNIILTGYRGSGKTTVGNSLANELRLPFFDIDAIVAKNEGVSISELFRSLGEAAFRAKERAAMNAMPTSERAVISLGGGAVMHGPEMKTLKAGGIVVWLRVGREVAIERMRKDHARPGLIEGLSLEEETEKLMGERNPVYERQSDLIVDVDDKSIGEVVSEIREKLVALGSL